MENLTHSLVGILLARTGLNRLSPGATTVLLLSANAPDLDIVTAAAGALRYLEVHRGYSHSFVGLPAMAALSVLLTAAIHRRRLPWGKLFALACLGVASHLLLDWTNSYGIRLLLPFSSQWFHADISNLWDGIVLAVLAFAAGWPLLSRLVSSEIGERSSRGSGLAVAALSFYLLFECGRGVLHARAVEQLRAPYYAGHEAVAVAALPASLNPLQWNGVVETANSYREIRVDITQNLDPDSGTVQYKIPQDGAVQAALGTEPFRFFVYFARFPVWSAQPSFLPSGRATELDLSDLRFGAPGTGSFHCFALVDEHGRVLQSRFTF